MKNMLILVCCLAMALTGSADSEAGKKKQETTSLAAVEPLVMIEAKCLTKSSDADSAGTVISNPRILIIPDGTGSVNTENNNVRILWEFQPVMEKDGIRLQGKLSLTTLGESETSTDAPFNIIFKDANTPVKLPPVKHNGKIIEFTLLAYLCDKNLKSLSGAAYQQQKIVVPVSGNKDGRKI